MTSRRPDQTWSIAQTLLSTRPVGREISRTTCSVMSVGTLAARLGQAIHSPQAGAIRARSESSCAASSARQTAKKTMTSKGTSPSRLSCTVTGPGSGSRLSANPGGALIRAIVWPDLMPSFLGSGVPESPAGAAGGGPTAAARIEPAAPGPADAGPSAAAGGGPAGDAEVESSAGAGAGPAARTGGTGSGATLAR